MALPMAWIFALLFQGDIDNLQHKDPMVRQRAAEILGLKKELSAVPYLIEGLADSEPAVSAACGVALRQISGQELGDAGAWREWWRREGSRVAVAVDPRTLQELRNLQVEVKGQHANVVKVREETKALEAQLKTITIAVVIVAVFFVLVMLYFVGHVSSRIKEWKGLMGQADSYIKEGRQVTERVDRIFDEVDKKKTELLDFYDKLKGGAEDEIERYADGLQQNSEHRLREEILELRQKAEKELEATLGELKTQIEHEMRRLAEAHRKRIDADSGEVHRKFLQDVEAHRLFMEGALYFSSNRHDDALASYRKLLQAKPDHVLGWLRLGDVYREQLNYDGAIEAYRKALELSPNDSKASYSMAAVYAKLHNREKMLEFLKRAISDDGEFKDEALNDPAFREYWNDPAFKDVAEG
jgi:tetratricopeptide (TPR) repeat protein